jgi:NAD(P)-dependent dehydrogenase (short-subunit alcohol dehydrogenase family)
MNEASCRPGSAPRRFIDKRVVVTGGASGIGLAIGKRFAGEGARVGLIDTSAAAMSAALEGLDADTLVGVIADVTSEVELQDAFVQMNTQLGGLDVLVNSAGIVSRGSIDETGGGLWDRVIDVDLSAVFLTTKAALPYLRTRKAGSVVNIASVAGMLAVVSAPYVAAKGGVIALTKQLASELASEGIRVNAISPGYVVTPLNEAVRAEGGDRYWKGRIPMRRYAEPEEIASACAFLASDDASYITGANLVVDGGLSSVLLPDRVPVE